MRISFKPYRRRDGSVMLYLNRSNGVSVGLSADRGISEYGKGVTKGMWNAYVAARRTFKAHAQPFTGMLDAHTEGERVDLANGWTLLTTDTATVGGMNVGADGAYIVAHGLILRCDTYAEQEE